LKIDQLLFWGIFGLVAEIFFTAITDLIKKKKINLIGHTSLWMFPIYSIGLTYGFNFVQQIITNDFIRYFSYPFWIWLVEILVGFPANKIGIKIWDYSYLEDNKHWRGIISFVHFPIWIIFGILVELVDSLVF